MSVTMPETTPPLATPKRDSLPSRVWQVVSCNNKAICITTAVVAVVGTVLALSGCAPEMPSTASPSTLAVVATTTQVADFSRQVAGTTATVTGLVQANQSVHGFDPSAKNLLDLAAADVLVTSGVDLEAWLNDAIEASGFAGTVIVATRLSAWAQRLRMRTRLASKGCSSLGLPRPRGLIPSAPKACR